MREVVLWLNLIIKRVSELIFFYQSL